MVSFLLVYGDCAFVNSVVVVRLLLLGLTFVIWCLCLVGLCWLLLFWFVCF